MILRKQHLGPTLASSLSGTATLKVTLPAGATQVEIQAALFSHKDAILHFRLSTNANLAATSLATAEAAMTHLGTEPINLNPRNRYYVYCLLTDVDGTNLPGGENDRILVLAETEVIR